MRNLRLRSPIAGAPLEGREARILAPSGPSPKSNVPKEFYVLHVGAHVCACVCVHVCLCVNTQGWIYPPNFQRADLQGGRDSLFCFKSAKLTIRSNLMHSLAVKDFKFQN